jgi:hypothetical protein
VSTAQLGAAGGADALAGAAVQEVVLEASLVSRPGAEPRQLLLPERVLGWPLPLYRPEPFAAHPQVGEAPEVGEFTELIPAALQVGGRPRRHWHWGAEHGVQLADRLLGREVAHPGACFLWMAVPATCLLSSQHWSPRGCCAG